MRIGQPVELHVDALPDGALSGVVDSFAPARARIRTAAARKRDRQLHEDRPARAGAHPPAADARAQRMLLPGLSVTVDVDTRSARDETHHG